MLCCDVSSFIISSRAEFRCRWTKLLLTVCAEHALFNQLDSWETDSVSDPRRGLEQSAHCAAFVMSYVGRRRRWGADSQRYKQAAAICEKSRSPSRLKLDASPPGLLGKIGARSKIWSFFCDRRERQTPNRKSGTLCKHHIPNQVLSHLTHCTETVQWLTFSLLLLLLKQLKCHMVFLHPICCHPMWSSHGEIDMWKEGDWRILNDVTFQQMAFFRMCAQENNEKKEKKRKNVAEK